LIVDSKAAMTASISVDVYIEASGPGGFGDRCANPSAIPWGVGTQHLIESTVGNANDYSEVITSDCPNAGPTACDRVYYFYLDSRRTITIDAGNASTANSYDQLGYIRSVCNDQSSQLACNDDHTTMGMQACHSGRYNSSVTATIGPGLFYFIADGWCGGTLDCSSSAASCVCGAFDYTITGI
jgi:hypothetical protein